MLNFVGLKDEENKLVKKFSGGMKRRLEIARGLLHHPEVLFLDEPTLGLDPQTRTRIWDYIKKLNKERKMTVFLTTHYIEEAEKMADRVAVIDHGKIIACGTPEEINKSVGAQSLEKSFLELTGREIRD
jgi:ABC-2 type transport system ATP-binding protein